jgi:hypothetical protein
VIQAAGLRAGGFLLDLKIDFKIGRPAGSMVRNHPGGKTFLKQIA